MVNREGQPLIEGKLKERQVRWKFIKRWKTRYFTLAGNQLLLGKGKSVSNPTASPLSMGGGHSAEERSKVKGSQCQKFTGGLFSIATLFPALQKISWL